jgi:hypothetical protein
MTEKLDWTRSIRIVQLGMKLKAKMIKKGIKAARTPCTICNKGHLHMRLAGPKNHSRLWCDVCDVRMME